MLSRIPIPIQPISYACIAALLACGGFAPASGANLMASRASAFEETRQLLEPVVRPHSGSIIDSIVIEGNTHTRRETIVREMATAEGGELDEQTIYRDYSYLRGLGFFSDVGISIVETSPGHCDVIVRVAERPHLFMKYPYPVVNYDLDRGVSYGFRWKVKNFQGTGQELFAGFEKRREREHGGSLGWRAPWFAGRRLRLELSAFSYRRLSEPIFNDYIKERYGGGIRFGVPLTDDLMRQIWITPDVSIESRDSRCSLDGAPNTGAELHRQVFLAAGLTLTFDSRDNLIASSRGIFAGASVKRFTSVDGPAQQYSFMSAAAHFYIPAGSLGTLILAMDAQNRDGAVPWFYQLGLGGETDLRGFDGEDLRGTSRLIGTIQLRRPVFGPLVYDIPLVGKFDVAVNAVAFLDRGALMDSFELIDKIPFHTTGGFGIEILSPFQDMIRLEAAFSEDGPPVYYLATGNRF